MIRRIPILPTLLVLAAVAVMVRLGFWQLDRLEQKEALIARYLQVQHEDAMIEWPEVPEEVPHSLYHQTRIHCREVIEQRQISGRNRNGQPGIAHISRCLVISLETSVRDEGLRYADVVLGWSPGIGPVDWQGGEVTGVIAPGPRLVAAPPLAGLQANALPDPRNIPNNHLMYAVQWFLFALTALVIYGLALRKRLGQSSPERGGGSPQD